MIGILWPVAERLLIPSNPFLDTTHFEIEIFRVPQNRPQEWVDE